MRYSACTLAIVSLFCVRTATAEVYFTGPTAIEDDQAWTNYLRLDDLDGDGDLDLVVPSCDGFFAAPSAQPFRIYENDGGTFAEVTAASLGETPSLAVRVVAVGDIDGDGDLDLHLPNAGGGPDRLYINDGSGVFTDEAAARLPMGRDASRSAGARFGDVDGDGDLDLFVAQGYAGSDNPPAWLLLNDGSGSFSDGTSQLPQSFPGIDPDDIDFLDVDRDFDLDVLINAHSGSSALWRNDGDGHFTDISGNMPGPVGGPFHYGPSACDIDDDGDLDLVIDNIGGSNRREQLLINDGTGQFTDGTSQLGKNRDADDNGVMCADVDDDGDFDLLIPSLSGNERILVNDAGSFTLENGGFPSVADPSLWMDLGDLNGDGRIDAVTGQGEGANILNRVYLGGGVMPVDATPPMIVTHETPDGRDTSADFALRFAVRDRIVTDSGPRVRAFARVNLGDAMSEVEATFMGGDLFRVTVPSDAMMAATVTLCAVDGAGNEGCTSPMAYGENSSGPGGGGDGAGGGGATSSSSGGGDAQGGGAGFGVEDDGCGCRTVRAPRSSAAGWWLLLGAGLIARRQRKL